MIAANDLSVEWDPETPRKVMTDYTRVVNVSLVLRRDKYIVRAQEPKVGQLNANFTSSAFLGVILDHCLNLIRAENGEEWMS